MVVSKKKVVAEHLRCTGGSEPMAAAVDIVEDVLCPVAAVLRTSRHVVACAKHVSINMDALNTLCSDVRAKIFALVFLNF